MRVSRVWVAGLLGCALGSLGAAAVVGAADEKASAVSPAPGTRSAGAEFFETRVRPVLAENCYSCHGPDRQMAGLRLDSRAALLKGSARGPIVVPGDPEKSALIRAVRYAGPIKMPPQGKLPDPMLQALAAWVKMGAPWPDTPAKAASAASGFAITEAQRTHWAFQPVRKPPLPAVKNAAWVRSPIDRFILAKLEQKGLKPARPTDKVTLLRRATLDLIGLPPTVAEIDAFLADHSPNAFAKVVDRLLASPHYGERWGRYWLDIARYADTKGYSFTADPHYPYAYSYRDYVIDAFNRDLPYDQFIQQQLAADRLPLGPEKRPLAAMGFLTVGRRFLNSQPDIIDDRIDVVGRGLMGLTVACARCHNHKFDPIPTKDYYSLYGVFASSNEPEPVVISPAATSEPYLAQKKQLDETEKQAGEIAQAQQDRLLTQYRGQVADYLLAVVELPPSADPKAIQARAAEGKLNPVLLHRWHHYVNDDAHDPIFGPLRKAIARETAGGKTPAGAGPSAADAPHPAPPLNARVARLLADHPDASARAEAQQYAALFAEIDKHWRDLQEKHRIASALASDAGQPPPKEPVFLPDPVEEALRRVLYNEGPLGMRREELEPSFEASARESLKSLQEKAKHLRETMPPTPEYAMVLEDAKEPRDPHVFIRGNPGNPGDEVPRQFLLIVAGEHRKPFQQGSGRLELAQAIASKENPLTARVMVNRIWLHHFGEGLVRTPSDFGMRSEPPTHPELLDYLATRFVESGWSVKQMHRAIMLSSAYQMSSEENDRGQKIDPENRLLWRMNRRRLDLEALRDSLLAVSGQLDPKIGGPAVEITKPPYPPRRTIYGFIDRQNLQGMFRTFDLASPDTTNSQRHQTTVPQQALFMMNSPFVVDQARHLAARRELAAMTDLARRIRYVYRLLFGRLPSADEVALGLRFTQSPVAGGATSPSAAQAAASRNDVQLVGTGSAGSDPSRASSVPMALTAWEQYIQVLLMTNEFAFVD